MTDIDINFDKINKILSKNPELNQKAYEKIKPSVDKQEQKFLAKIKAIVEVKFDGNNKPYYFNNKFTSLKINQRVLVDTKHGPVIGYVTDFKNKDGFESNHPTKNVLKKIKQSKIEKLFKIDNNDTIDWKQFIKELPKGLPKIWKPRKDKYDTLIRYENQDASQKSIWWFIDKNNMRQCHNLLVYILQSNRYEYLSKEESMHIIDKIKGDLPIEGSQNFDELMLETIRELNPNAIHPMFQFIGADEFMTPSLIETEHFLFWRFKM